MKIIAAIFDFTAAEGLGIFSTGVRKEKESGGCRLKVVQFSSNLTDKWFLSNLITSVFTNF